MEIYLQMAKAKRYFLFSAKQTTGIASINMTQLKALPVMLPTLNLQTQFAAFVHQVDATKSSVQSQLDSLTTLRAKLMQDFFG